MIRPVTTGAPATMQRIGAIGERNSRCGTSSASSVTVRVITNDNSLISNAFHQLSVHNHGMSRCFHLQEVLPCTDVDYSNHYYYRRAYNKAPGVATLRTRGGNMRISDIEQAVRAGLADKELKARIVNEGPVALSDVFMEIEAREAARTLTGRAIEMDSELKVQRATNAWL